MDGGSLRAVETWIGKAFLAFMVLLQFCRDQRIGEAKAGPSAVLLKFEEKNPKTLPLQIHDNTKPKPRIG